MLGLPASYGLGPHFRFLGLPIPRVSEVNGVIPMYLGVEDSRDQPVGEGSYGYLLILIRYLHIFLIEPLYLRAQ